MMKVLYQVVTVDYMGHISFIDTVYNDYSEARNAASEYINNQFTSYVLVLDYEKNEIYGEELPL